MCRVVQGVQLCNYSTISINKINNRHYVTLTANQALQLPTLRAYSICKTETGSDQTLRTGLLHETEMLESSNELM